MSKSEINLGIDSQCLSYWLDSLDELVEPIDNLAVEKIALTRIWLYTEGGFTASETVIAECQNIKNHERRQLHNSWVGTHIHNPPIRDNEYIKQRTKALSKFHSGEQDCRILAEAEEIGLDILLTYDFNFLNRLREKSDNILLYKPSEYWSKLNLSHGIKPNIIPHKTNPMSVQEWWRW